MPDSYLKRYVKVHGFPCPRQELYPLDVPAWMIVRTMWAGGSELASVIETETWWMHAELKRRTLRVAQRVYQSQQVQDKMKELRSRETNKHRPPKPKRPR